VVDDLDGVDRDDEVRRMLGALETLRPRYQQAIKLRYLADLEAEDAARAMGCTKPVLAVTLHRALAALRRAVERDSR
jgi:RNA polymerase sigma factor (sigma-70 family)